MSDYRQLCYYPPPQPPTGPSTAQPHNHVAPCSTSRSDDLKYVAKYKELKRKVKDTELDNDRLHVKVLKARKNIQRLRLERAILYERLATMSAPNSVPFPSDPGSFPAPHPQQPYNSVHGPVHYGNLPVHGAEIEPMPQGTPRHTRVHHSQAPRPPPVSNAPPQHYARHPEDSLRAGPSHSHLEPPPAMPPQPPAPTMAHGPNGARTFPFVLEYAPVPITIAPAPAYPAEVRFYPYESSTHPAQRSRRDSEQAGNAPRAAERERELKFRHHRPETQTQSQPRSPGTAHGNYAYPLQHPFLSPEETRRGVESDRAPHGPHGSYQVVEEARRREAANSPRKNIDGGGSVHQLSREEHDAYGQQHDVGRHLPPHRRGSYEQSEQDLDTFEHTKHERQRVRTSESEGDAPPRIQESEAMD